MTNPRSGYAETSGEFGIVSLSLEAMSAGRARTMLSLVTHDEDKHVRGSWLLTETKVNARRWKELNRV